MKTFVLFVGFVRVGVVPEWRNTAGGISDVLNLLGKVTEMLDLKLHSTIPLQLAFRQVGNGANFSSPTRNGRKHSRRLMLRNRNIDQMAYLSLHGDGESIKVGLCPISRHLDHVLPFVRPGQAP